MRFISLLFVLLLTTGATYAQGLNSEGREFYLGHINASHTQVASALAVQQLQVYAIISSYTDNEVFVSYYDPNTGIETTPKRYTIAAYHSVEVPLDRLLMSPTEPGDLAEYRTCHITAAQPVAVHYFSFGSCATGGYLALPVGTWGKSYVIASDPDNPGVGALVSPPAIPAADRSNGCFMVIAGANNTKVTITPNAQTGGGHIGTTQGPGATGVPHPYTVTLNRGQCYFVKSVSAYRDEFDDLSGSIVTAEKPVAVIMGHENANVGDGAVKESHLSDTRDLIIEQAIPWEFAGDTAWSFLMRDSQGQLDGGQGEDVKVLVGEEDRAATVGIGGCGGAPVAYMEPPLIKTNVTAPLQFTCENNKRIQVLQYELRSDGSGTPYTAPAMTNIVGDNSRRNAYLWHVPKLTGIGGAARYQEYYVSVVGSLSIEPEPKIVKRWCSGRTYRIEPGVTYYAHNYSYLGDLAMVYVFGYIGTEEAPGIINYSSFAYPAGLRARSNIPARIGVEVKDSCGSYTICAVDSSGRGIRSIVLLSDAQRNFITERDMPRGGPLKATNCKLDDPTTPGGSEIYVLDPPAQLCAKVSVLDTGKIANIPLIVTDVVGNMQYVGLYYFPPRLTITSSGDLADVRVGDTATMSINLQSSSIFKVRSIEISDSVHFQITQPKLPVTLEYSSSLGLDLTYIPLDTLPRVFTVKIGNGCTFYEESYTAQGMTGLIAAADKDFGNVSRGIQKCHDVNVSNIGKAKFEVAGIKITGSSAFSVDSTELKKLPVTIDTGNTITLNVCYRPTQEGVDTATLQWITDIREPYSNSVKSFSVLTGTSLSQSVESRSEPSISIVPNPNNGQFTLDIRMLEEGEKIDITIYNMLGAVCYYTTGIGGKQKELVPELPAGTYTVRITTSGKVYDEKVVIQ